MKVSDVSVAMIEQVLRDGVFSEYRSLASTEDEEVRVYSSEYSPVEKSRTPLIYRVGAKSVVNGEVLKKVSPESIVAALGIFRAELEDATECIFQVNNYSTQSDADTGLFRLWFEIHLCNLSVEVQNRSW